MPELLMVCIAVVVWQTLTSKNEIDERVVGLGGEHGHGQQEQRQRYRGLARADASRPIPRLRAGPHDERTQRDGSQIVRLAQ